jgi:hypothetical protein
MRFVLRQRMNQILNMKYKKIKNKHKLIEMKRESKIKKPYLKAV